MLPLLSPYDLASLSCTCTTLRDTVHQQDQAWVISAASHLPLPRSQAQPQDRRAVQLVMQQHASAIRNVKRGRVDRCYGLWTDFGGRDPVLAFSPDGKLLSCQTSWQLSIVTAGSGALLWTQSIQDLIQQAGLSFDTFASGLSIAWHGSSEELLAFKPDAVSWLTASVRHAALMSIDVWTGTAKRRAFQQTHLSEEILACAQPAEPASLSCVGTFSPGAGYLAVQTSGHVPCALVAVYDTTTGANLVSFLIAGEAQPHSCCWSQDGNLFAGSGYLINTAKQSITSTDSRHCDCTVCFDHNAELLGFTGFHSLGRKAVFVNADSGNTMSEVPNLAFDCFIGRSRRALISPQSTKQARYHVWDVDQNHELYHLDIAGTGLRYLQINFVLSDKLFVAKGARLQTVSFWAADSRQRVLELGRCHAWQMHPDHCSVAIVRAEGPRCAVRILKLA